MAQALDWRLGGSLPAAALPWDKRIVGWDCSALLGLMCVSCFLPRFQMDKLGLSEENVQRYKERVREHDLSGRALVYSDRNEIRDVLGMGLGEWMAFSLYFLGSVPPQGCAPAAAAPVPALDEKKWLVLQEDSCRGSRLSIDTSRENLHR